MAKPLSLYLHIPFCKKKCAYCSFYSTAVTNEMTSNFVTALTNEIKKWGGRTDRPINTIYFGGGTPSALDIAQIKALIECIFSCFNVNKDCEITFELNPEKADFEYLKALKELKINRLSIGMQSADDFMLKLLGRRHTCDDTKACINTARSVGFNNISLDLMLCLPNSNKATLEKSLEFIKAVSPEHISAYMLSLEENTLLYKKKYLYTFPDEESEAEEYLYLCNALKEMGYNHYEISNFCKEGFHSRHNNVYWNCQEYIGIGPSAYSYFEGERFHYANDLRAFIKGSDTVYDEEGGSLYEYVMLKLRLSSGLNQKELKQLYNKTFSNKFIEKANMLKAAGLVNFSGESISLTENGMLISNSIITELTEEELYENV